MVGFGLDYACAHIIILAEISSENLLPIRADFVTERDIQKTLEPGLSFNNFQIARATLQLRLDNSQLSTPLTLRQPGMTFAYQDSGE